MMRLSPLTVRAVPPCRRSRRRSSWVPVTPTSRSGHADALGQSAQHSGDCQQDSYRGEEDEKAVRGQRRYWVHMSPSDQRYEPSGPRLPGQRRVLVPYGPYEAKEIRHAADRLDIDCRVLRPTRTRPPRSPCWRPWATPSP